MAKHAPGLKSKKAIRSLIEGDLVKALGSRKVSDIRRRNLIEAIEAKAEIAPRQSGHLLVCARKMLDYAVDRNFIPANPLAGLRPSSITVNGKCDPLRQVARARFLDPDEVRAFWSSVETCGLHRLTALALRLVLVTGQRQGEVSGMHVKEIAGTTWTIPAARRGKTDTAHKVHLTKSALEIIEAAKGEVARLSDRRMEAASGHMLEAWPGKAVSNAALARAVGRAAGGAWAKDVPQWGDWTPHDLRRTMRTGLSACGVRADIAELTIGHVKTGIVAVYDQHGFEAERRAALEAWESRLLAIVAGKGPDQVEAGKVV